jgi:hypothetical protein
MIIQNNNGKITIVSLSDELLDIHKTLGYELMEQPDFDVTGKKLKLDDEGNLVVDTELMEQLENDKRVASIKAKAGELVLEEYPIYKQNNVLMVGVQEDIDTMKSYIENIRDISNNAETDGTLLEDIDWTR